MNTEYLFPDVAIIGGGPAGLSAALMLGRSCRQVIVIDHGQYRNYAARQLHGYAGHDGVSPELLRNRCREELLQYDVQIINNEVIQVTARTKEQQRFQVALADGRKIRARKLIFATGMTDQLPNISGLRECYGLTVHHCPYCDGWEHRGKKMILLGSSSSALETALLLQCWSQSVAVCTDGQELRSSDRAKLHKRDIDVRQEKVSSLRHVQGLLKEIVFDQGPPLPAEALFFSSGQAQRSSLPESLGCHKDESGQYACQGSQKTTIQGVYIVGDAAEDLQFAILAAAEGVKAAVSIHQELHEENLAEDEMNKR
jgi:thioredoxin reductase